MGSKWKQKVVQSFDACVNAYEQYSTIQREVAENLADEFPNYNAPSVLEIGCGTGFLTQSLLKRYPDGYFHITDIAPRMLECVQKKFTADDRDIKWFVMDGENPKSKHRYDLIVSSMTFQWFEDLSGSLRRLQSLLKAGGCLLYAMPGPETFREWHAALEEHQLSSGVLNFEKPDSVFKEEQSVIDYQSSKMFLKHLKKTGAHVPRKGYQRLSKPQLSKIHETLNKKSQGTISWHILYGSINA